MSGFKPWSPDELAQWEHAAGGAASAGGSEMTYLQRVEQANATNARRTLRIAETEARQMTAPQSKADHNERRRARRRADRALELADREQAFQQDAVVVETRRAVQARLAARAVNNAPARAVVRPPIAPIAPVPVIDPAEHVHRMVIERVDRVEVGHCACGHERVYADPEASRK